ncbi:MAG: hypothetical protein ACPH14_09950 [Candidatus Puniceispirillaceae bacterium]
MSFDDDAADAVDRKIDGKADSDRPRTYYNNVSPHDRAASMIGESVCLQAKKMKSSIHREFNLPLLQ